MTTAPTVAPPRAALIKTPAWARRRRFDRVRRGGDRGSDSRRRSPVASASSSSGRSNLAASNLRELLAGDEILRAPCAHDALTAALIERAGFKVGFMSGFCVSAARLAMPDAGLISYGEMEDVGRHITQATSAGFPFIGDADDGYGNAMNAKRTVRGYARAGFAGILMEDQRAPKACGHTKPRCLGRDEAVARVRAACDERDEGPGGDIVVFARSDSRSAMDSLDEALWRVAAFADAGADALFVDALRTKDELRAFCKAVPGTPKMANMLEGGGRTPICSPEELQDMGFSVVAYPLTVLGAYVNATERVLREIKEDGYPDESRLPTFESLKATCGFPGYYADAERYDVTSGK